MREEYIGKIIGWTVTVRPCSECKQRSKDGRRECAKLVDGRIVGPCCLFDRS